MKQSELLYCLIFAAWEGRLFQNKLACISHINRKLFAVSLHHMLKLASNLLLWLIVCYFSKQKWSGACDTDGNSKI